jgi:hypothetical protein
MTEDARRAELRALLTRAATLEVERQAAVQRGDAAAVEALMLELVKLWSAHADLERVA